MNAIVRNEDGFCPDVMTAKGLYRAGPGQGQAMFAQACPDSMSSNRWVGEDQLARECGSPGFMLPN